MSKQRITQTISSHLSLSSSNTPDITSPLPYPQPISSVYAASPHTAFPS